MIIEEKPPNFDRILAAFPDAGGPGIIFAYGQNIYNPSGKMIPPALMAHEAVHCSRQDGLFLPDAWWGLYLTDAQFRYNEELLAHVAEYKAQAGGLDGNYRAKLLMSTARRLIAPLYNYQPPRRLHDALHDLGSRV